MITVELVKRFEVDVELTRPGTCLPATYRNDAENPTFEVTIPSSGLFVANPIEVKEVDGSIDTQRANENVTCKWYPILVRSTDGTVTAFTLDEFPEGARINALSTDVLNPDGTLYLVVPWRQEVRIANATILSVTTTNGQTQIEVSQPTLCEQISASTAVKIFQCLSAGQQTELLQLLFTAIRVESSEGYLWGEITGPDSPFVLDDIGVIDNNGPVAGTFPAPALVQIIGEVESASHANGVLQITPASGAVDFQVIPNRVIPRYAATSFYSGDLGWQWENGIFHFNDGPGIVQELDPAAGNEYYFRLKQNNPFGNKYRFTDDQGQPSASGRLGFPQEIDVPNSPGATPGYFIDNRTGLGWVNAPVARGRNYYTCIDKVLALVVGTYSDFHPPSDAEYESLFSLMSFIFTGVNPDYPFTNGGSGILSHDPMGNGTINQVWLNEETIALSNARIMQNFRLRVTDANPTLTSANTGIYACRKHF